MRTSELTRKAPITEDAAVVEAARHGDKSAFSALAERYRRELQAYCYRMLGSFDDSQDLVQDTLLKAWKNRESFEGRSSLRSWLYSALQRARETLRENPAERRPAPTELGAERERAFLARYVDAHERRDVDAIAAMLHDDLRFSMPPDPGTYAGRDEIVRFWVEGGFGTAEFGEFRCVVTHANRVPAVALYRKKPDDDRYRPLALDVLRIEGERIREITTFDLRTVREAFELPEELA